MRRGLALVWPFVLVVSSANAQEIYLTGPLAGVTCTHCRIPRCTDRPSLGTSVGRFDGRNTLGVEASYGIDETLSLAVSSTRVIAERPTWIATFGAQASFADGKLSLFDAWYPRFDLRLDLGAAVVSEVDRTHFAPNVGGAFRLLLCRWITLEVAGGAIPYVEDGAYRAHPRVSLGLTLTPPKHYD